MELTIKDRLYIPALLPKEGTFRQFNIKKDILQKVEISENERKEINLHENTETKRIEWDHEKECPLHIEFSEEQTVYLKEICEKMSEQNLHDEMWATVEKLYDMGN